MNRKHTAYVYLGAIVAMSILAANPEPEAGSPLGWMFFGSLMTGLIYGLVRTINYVDPNFKPQRGSRRHDNDIEVGR